MSVEINNTAKFSNTSKTDQKPGSTSYYSAPPINREMVNIKLLKKIPNNTLKKAAIIAFIPFLGPFGVHDSIINKPKQAKIHRLLAIPVFFFEFFAFAAMGCDSGCSGLQRFFTGVIAFSPIITFIASYIWAINEGISIKKVLKYREKNKNFQT